MFQAYLLQDREGNDFAILQQASAEEFAYGSAKDPLHHIPMDVIAKSEIFSGYAFGDAPVAYRINSRSMLKGYNQQNSSLLEDVWCALGKEGFDKTCSKPIWVFPIFFDVDFHVHADPYEVNGKNFYLLQDKNALTKTHYCAVEYLPESQKSSSFNEHLDIVEIMDHYHVDNATRVPHDFEDAARRQESVISVIKGGFLLYKLGKSINNKSPRHSHVRSESSITTVGSFSDTDSVQLGFDTFHKAEIFPELKKIHTWSNEASFRWYFMEKNDEKFIIFEKEHGKHLPGGYDLYIEMAIALRKENLFFLDNGQMRTNVSSPKVSAYHIQKDGKPIIQNQNKPMPVITYTLPNGKSVRYLDKTTGQYINFVGANKPSLAQNTTISSSTIDRAQQKSCVKRLHTSQRQPKQTVKKRSPSEVQELCKSSFTNERKPPRFRMLQKAHKMSKSSFIKRAHHSPRWGLTNKISVTMSGKRF